MPLGSNPGPFDQTPIDVSGFTSGPGSPQRRGKEGRRQLRSHPVAWHSPPCRVTPVRTSNEGSSASSPTDGKRLQETRRVGGLAASRPAEARVPENLTPHPSPVFHPHAPNKVTEHRRWIQRCPFCLRRQNVLVCHALPLLQGLGRTNVQPTSFETGRWLLCQKSRELSPACIAWVCSYGPPAFEELLALFSLKRWNG